MFLLCNAIATFAHRDSAAYFVAVEPCSRTRYCDSVQQNPSQRPNTAGLTTTLSVFIFLSFLNTVLSK